jgi:hypothetical protein
VTAAVAYASRIPLQTPNGPMLLRCTSPVTKPDFRIGEVLRQTRVPSLLQLSRNLGFCDGTCFGNVGKSTAQGNG